MHRLTMTALSALLVSTTVLAQEGRPGQGPGGQSPLVRALDADGDGKLSPAEIAAASEALKKLDRDEDGELSAQELGTGRAPDRGPRGRAPQSGGASYEKAPVASDEAEKKILEVLGNLDSDRRGNMNVPRTDGRLLRLLAETIQAKKVVEIGTSNGYSGIWIALALRKTGGKLVTHEIDPRRAELARANFERAGVGELISIVEGDAHETVQKLEGPIDLVFLDADKQGYLDYLQKLLPLVRPGGLILAHNMNPGQADPRFLAAITTDPALDTLFYMQGGGMAVSLKKR